ncbi:hypothetical protein QUA79_16915 [Microcoleus sp. F8-D1]
MGLVKPGWVRSKQIGSWRLSGIERGRRDGNIGFILFPVARELYREDRESNINSDATGFDISSHLAITINHQELIHKNKTRRCGFHLKANC